MNNEIFDLEQQIMTCWNMVDDVDMLYKHVGDSENFEGMSPTHADEIMNILLGMKSIYQIKFDTLFNNFEGVTGEFHARGREVERLIKENCDLALMVTDKDKVESQQEDDEYDALEDEYLDLVKQLEQIKLENKELRARLRSATSSTVTDQPIQYAVVPTIEAQFNSHKLVSRVATDFGGIAENFICAGTKEYCEMIKLGLTNT